MIMGSNSHLASNPAHLLDPSTSRFVNKWLAKLGSSIQSLSTSVSYRPGRTNTKLFVVSRFSLLKSFYAVSSSRLEEMKYLKPARLFQELLETNSLKKNRLLGLDVGDKYVGLAVSDVNNKIASPLSVLLRKKTNMDLMAHDFQLLISELSLTGFVVGYPFARQMKSHQDAVQVKVFIDDLCETGKLDGVSYTFWNESFTSKNVEFLLKPLNLHPVQSKTMVDKFAAVGILQGYLDFVNRSESLISTDTSSE